MTELKVGDRVHVEFDGTVTRKYDADGVIIVSHGPALWVQNDDGYDFEVSNHVCTKIKPPAKLGPFDPEVDYPEDTKIVSASGVLAYRTDSGKWMSTNDISLRSYSYVSLETISKNWKATVVWLPEGND